MDDKCEEELGCDLSSDKGWNSSSDVEASSEDGESEDSTHQMSENGDGEVITLIYITTLQISSADH